MFKNMIEKSANGLFSSASQRRWLWANHPDIALPLEERELAVNQAVDIINARQGLMTHYSIYDYMKTPSSVVPYVKPPKLASLQELTNSINHAYAHGITSIPSVRRMVEHTKHSLGIKPPPLIPEHYMLPVGIGLGMAGASAVRTVGGMVNPRGFVRGVSKDMIREYIQAENDYYNQQGVQG